MSARCGNDDPHAPHDYYLKRPIMFADSCPGIAAETTPKWEGPFCRDCGHPEAFHGWTCIGYPYDGACDCTRSFE